MALRAFHSRHSLAALSSISIQVFSSSRAGLAAVRHFSSSPVLPGSNPLGSGGGRSSSVSGFRLQWPLSRHTIARWRSWETLADCKHWLIVLDFPKDPKPTREEMISTYVKTLANVLGSVDEAKKKIYALSTTVYTGFQCKIDEATSEKLKDQPLVSWVLPDGYGDPENGIFAGDRYDNGVITPDPRPPRPVNDRSRNYDRQRSYDRPRYDRDVRPRAFRPMEGRDNVQEDRRDYRPREGETMQGERQQYRSMMGSQTTQEYGRDYRPMEGRDSLRGQDDYTSREARNPMQGNQKG